MCGTFERGLISAPLIPAGIPSFRWTLEESSGMKFGRMACYFLHSGVISFQWNLGIPELRPEFAGTECNGMESSCLVNTLFGIHCLFVAHLLTNKHNILPFPPPTIVSHHHHLSFPPPPTMLVTTTTLHDCPWTPMTTNDRSATMTGQKTKMATSKRQPMPTPRMTAWTHKQTWAVTSPGESTRPSSPFISFIQNTGATLQLVTWQPNDEWQHCQLRRSLLLLISDTTVSIPHPTFIPIHLTETQDDNNLAQWRDVDMGRWQHQQYGNLVSSFCRFSLVFWFPET